MARIVECVPNFSEGRNKEVIEAIVDEVRRVNGVKLLDYSPDEDHNRTVVTFVGDPENVKIAAFNLAKKASELIDMRVHKGGHPRMGATDVMPFIPVSDVAMADCIEIAREVGKRIGEELGIPVYLYEDAASADYRKNLADVRRGQYEGFFDKIRQQEWKPDFGPGEMNAKSGATAVGARVPLVAFNVNLSTNNKEIAAQIAKNIRHLNGGLRFCKAIAIDLSDKGIAQVSMNMTDYTKTALYRAYELIKIEARRFGIHPIGSEIVGTIPMEALIDTAVYYLGVENFTMNQILETRLME